MGTENSKTVSDNGIQNLSRSDIITIRFKKESYYEGQTVEGEIILEPKQNLVMNDILIKFKQSEYFVYVVDEKNTVSDLNSQTFFEKRINAGEYLNMNSQMLSLTPNTYKFPFQFTLPRDIPPSFEYPFRNRRASLRYTFSAELLSPYVKSLSETYMWIKARPINIPSQIKHENYVKVKNVGIVSRGQSGIALFTMASNYRINDMLPFTVDIYNEDCAVQVKEVKISIKRIVTFMKGGKEYQKRTAIIRKKYPCLCDRNSKNSFHYDDIQIRDHDLKDVDYNRTLNPYPFLDDLNMLMPNVKTNLIKCEYSLKATSYFDLSVLGKDRPRVEMPIYVTHQLQKEYEYEKDTNQNNGQGVNSYGNNFNSFGGNNFGNNNFGNNNSFGNNNNNFGGNNNNFGGSNNNNFGGNNNNNFGGSSNNNNFGGSNNNNNNNKSSGSGSLSSSQKFSYEAYIASKKMNAPSTDKNSNNDSWKSKSSFPNYGNNNNNWGSSNNNNNWGSSNNNNNWGNNNNNNNWGSNNNNNNWGNNNNNNNNWGNNNNNNNNWGNNNNNNNWGRNNNNSNNNNWGNNNNNNNNNWGNNNNNWGNNNNNNNYGNNNNNNNFGGNNYNRGPYGGGFNGSANPFGGGNNDFPSLDNINNKNNSSSSNQPSNPFGDNNGPSNPFGNNNDNPSNPFGNNNNSGNPPNPFGGSGGGSGPYQASYPGF